METNGYGGYLIGGFAERASPGVQNSEIVHTTAKNSTNWQLAYGVYYQLPNFFRAQQGTRYSRVMRARETESTQLCLQGPTPAVNSHFSITRMTPFPPPAAIKQEHQKTATRMLNTIICSAHHVGGSKRERGGCKNCGRSSPETQGQKSGRGRRNSE